MPPARTNKRDTTQARGEARRQNRQLCGQKTQITLQSICLDNVLSFPLETWTLTRVSTPKQAHALVLSPTSYRPQERRPPRKQGMAELPHAVWPQLFTNQGDAEKYAERTSKVEGVGTSRG